MVGSLAPSPHPQMLSKSHLINTKPVVVERGLLGITRHPFHLYGSDAFSGAEDKRPDIITKDALIALIGQDIPGVLGAVSQEPWKKTKFI